MAGDGAKRRDGPARRVGRLLMAGVFIHGGYHTLREPEKRAGRASVLPLPMDPEQAVRLNAVAMIAGGAAFGLGIVPRLAASGLLMSLGLTTAAGHPFWKEETEQARRAQ